MSKTRLLLSLPLDCETAVAAISRRLTHEGLCVEAAFHLESACAPFTIDTCPHTGTSPCPCKMVVLRVFEARGPRLALIIHSHDNMTEFWEEVIPALSKTPLAHRVRQLLEEEKVILLSPID